MAPIVANTPTGSRFWRILHLPPVLLLVAVAMFAIARQCVRAFGIKPQLADIRVALPAALVTVAIFSFTYWMFVRFIERRQRVDEFAPAGAGFELAVGVLLGLVSFSIVVGIISVFGGYRVIGYNQANVLLPVLVIALKSGVIEEIIARGIIFRIVERSLGSWLALLLSSALFGAVHIGNPNATLWTTVAVGIEGGLISAALYMLTRRLWAAIGEHFAWNLTQGGLYGIPISGWATDGLLNARVTGPTALTGGAFGAEASIPALVIAVVLSISLLILAARRGRIVHPFWTRTALKSL